MIRMRKICLLILLVLSLVSCQDKHSMSENEGDQRGIQGSGLYRHFTELYPEKELLVWALKDLDNDGANDLVLIYRMSAEKNVMRIILDAAGRYTITNDVPAPISNQIITFRDIDEKPPIELVVQGMKGTKIGYAVYRVENGRLIDLFGEGMDECC